MAAEELLAEDFGALSDLVAQPQTSRLAVDLARQTIEGEGLVLGFAIDAPRKHALLNGLDAVGLSLARADEILAFEQAHLRDHPWLAPGT